MESNVVATQQKTYFFSNRDLAKLFIPLIIEQGLEYLVGLIASILVSRVGEAAVSGVSLVEFLMALFISIFAAFATGGGIVAGQYLGDRDGENANKAINQLAKFTLIFSIMITVFIFAIKPLILNHLLAQLRQQFMPKPIGILISLPYRHHLLPCIIVAQRFLEP